VYAAGFGTGTAGAVARLWKNGVVVPITSGATESGAVSVFVAGTDVYVAGYERNAVGTAVSKVWKNGVATSLTNGTFIGEADAVFVK